MPRKDSQKNASDSGDDGAVTRRRLIASGAAAWTTVSLAGCSYITDPGPPDQDGSSDDSDTPSGGTNGTATVTNETTTTNDTSTPSGTPGGDDCQSSQEFIAGMEVGLNVGVYDSQTGEYLGGDDIDQVTVEFPNADIEPLELSWSGPHEQYIPDGWGGKIETDPDMETGTYQYEINIDGAEVFDGEETIADRFTLR